MSGPSPPLPHAGPFLMHLSSFRVSLRDASGCAMGFRKSSCSRYESSGVASASAAASGLSRAMAAPGRFRCRGTRREGADSQSATALAVTDSRDGQWRPVFVLRRPRSPSRLSRPRPQSEFQSQSQFQSQSRSQSPFQSQFWTQSQSQFWTQFQSQFQSQSQFWTQS